MEQVALKNNVSPSTVCIKGAFILQLLASIESSGHRLVYLRNYEQLPDDIGNDVDLLVEKGHTKAIVDCIRLLSPQYGWKIWKSVEFSCRSVFLVSTTSSEVLHIDLFECIEWHVFPFANAETILARRKWNGQVHIPADTDELFLNLFTRLIYQGVIRDKHRKQWVEKVKILDEKQIEEDFASHLPDSAMKICCQLASSGDWQGLEALKSKLRRTIIVNATTRHFLTVLKRTLAYIRRTLKRLICPPGMFIVFLGADGVGKSTIINGAVPCIENDIGLKGTLFFHWKPQKESISVGEVPRSVPQNPRGKACRGRFLSCLFLCYHWATFLVGYIRYVLPQTARNRLVVGDRYSYDVLFDPIRFRLHLPQWILRVFVKTLPRPDLVLALVANPETIISRKPELSIDEINLYQKGLKSGIIPNLVIVNAEATADIVAEQAYNAILEAFGLSCH